MVHFYYSGGASKSVWSYTVDRTPASNKETTNLGIADPNDDYIIGAWANGIMFGKLKGLVGEEVIRTIQHLSLELLSIGRKLITMEIK